MTTLSGIGMYCKCNTKIVKTRGKNNKKNKGGLKSKHLLRFLSIT